MGTIIFEREQRFLSWDNGKAYAKSMYSVMVTDRSQFAIFAKEKIMSPQNSESGAEAHRFGRANARYIASQIGAQMIENNSNANLATYRYNDEEVFNVIIKSENSGTIGVRQASLGLPTSITHIIAATRNEDTASFDVYLVPVCVITDNITPVNEQFNITRAFIRDNGELLSSVPENVGSEEENESSPEERSCNMDARYYTSCIITRYSINQSNGRIASIQVKSDADYSFKELDQSSNQFNIFVKVGASLPLDKPNENPTLFDDLFLARPSKTIGLRNQHPISDLGNTIISLHQNARKVKVTVKLGENNTLTLVSLQAL